MTALDYPSGLCKCCHGTGSLFNVQNGKFEWHTCPACHGHGSRNDYRGEKFIRSHAS